MYKEAYVKIEFPKMTTFEIKSERNLKFHVKEIT